MTHTFCSTLALNAYRACGEKLSCTKNIATQLHSFKRVFDVVFVTYSLIPLHRRERKSSWLRVGLSSLSKPTPTSWPHAASLTPLLRWAEAALSRSRLRWPAHPARGDSRRFWMFCMLLVFPVLSTCLTILGDLDLETYYGFPLVVQSYTQTHANLTIELPFGNGVDNVASLLDGSTDFAITPGPLTAEQAANHPNATVMPILGSAIVPIYRLDALGSSVTLTLSGNTLALIFAGEVTWWNDSRIARDNARVLFLSNTSCITVKLMPQGIYIDATALFLEKLSYRREDFLNTSMDASAARPCPCLVSKSSTVTE